MVERGSSNFAQVNEKNRESKAFTDSLRGLKDMRNQIQHIDNDIGRSGEPQSRDDGEEHGGHEVAGADFGDT